MGDLLLSDKGHPVQQDCQRKQLGCICTKLAYAKQSAVQLSIFGSKTAVTNMTSLKLFHCPLEVDAPSCGLSSLSVVLRPCREEGSLAGVLEGHINVSIPLQHGIQRGLFTNCSHTTASVLNRLQMTSSKLQW